MRYVNEFKTAAELASALLTPRGVMVPAYRNAPEHRVNVDDVIQRIPLRAVAVAAAESLTDATHAGFTLRREIMRVAADMARDLLIDWSEDAA